MNKKHLLFLNYHSTPQFNYGLEKLNAFKFSYDVIHELKQDYTISLIDFINKKDYFNKDGISYYFRPKTKNSFLNTHFKTHQLIKQLSPDFIYVHSLKFIPFLLFLLPFLKPKTKLIVQHHAEKSPKSFLKQKLVRFIDSYIDNYIFTANELAYDWKLKGIIAPDAKIYTQPELSTFFKASESLKKDPNLFLWVGRLNDNKNPILVIKGFINYIKVSQKAKLIMFYSENDLLEDIKQLLNTKNLNNHIVLKGKVSHNELEFWYQKSTYFLLGSFYEGGSAALIESMACGCIPIVTDIPSNRTITNNGEFAVLFETGNQKDLEQKLAALGLINNQELSNSIIEHFNTRLSFKALANGIHKIISKL